MKSVAQLEKNDKESMMNKSTIGVPLKGFGEFTRNVATEGIVLLKNENHMLPILRQEVVSVFGRCQIDYYRSGTGSGGAVNVLYSVNALEGFRNNDKITVNESLASAYEMWVKDHPFDNGGGGWAAEPWFQKEMLLTSDQVESARAVSEKAIVIIGRTAGEDKDNHDIEGSYRLTVEEKEMLVMVTKYFQKVAVILNVANIIDMSWLEDETFENPIQAVVYAWQGGGEGGNALADVISGDVTPSGKLTDTIAYDLKSYPTYTNFGSLEKNEYQEDIYVGYRYFETFQPHAVQFPFGFGLSYTTFQIETKEVEVVGQGLETRLDIRVKVTNTGDKYTGKEVVQVYYGAPQGQLGKPVKVLGAFAKTAVLKPGSSQTLTLELPIKRMTSYDDGGYTGHKSSYVLEPGAYRIYVGNSVKTVEAVRINGRGAYFIEDLLVVEALQEAMAPIVDFKRMKPGAEKSDATYELTYEPVPKQTISLKDRIEQNLPSDYKQTGNQGIVLKDVERGKATLEAFIAQLDQTDLAIIVRGEGMSNPKVTPGTAAAFGGVSDTLLEYGIPVACAADGPSGIRMDSGHVATQVPIGTLLACSWNVEMMEELYDLEGQEMVLNEIDTLLGPGINIHRNPLNGRNFEYFSEDPYITGCFAAAVTRGLNKSGSTGTVKHFAANDQETSRHKVDSIVSERALREIHLKGFEMAVKEGQATSIMTAYNPINGHWAASHYDLNTTILRGEWGYRGIVMTDWWAMMNHPVDGGKESRQSTSFMVRAQNDLYMVVNNNGAEVNSMGDDIEEALEKGTLTIGELQRSAMNICQFIMDSLVFKKAPKVVEIQNFKASIQLPDGVGTVYNVPDQMEIHTKTNNSMMLKVSKANTYNLIVKMRYDQNHLAQSSCNILLNGAYIANIQINGTYGQWMAQKVMRLNLEAGFYELTLDFMKPGMEIGSIEISSKGSI